MTRERVNMGLCPYCAQPMAGRKPSREHVFTRSFGGRTIIKVCQKCNSALGHEVEGRLMQHDQILNLARAAHGMESLPIRGTTDTGEGVNWDIGSGEVTSARPVVVRKTANEEIRTYQTSPQHAERLLRREGRSEDEIAHLLAGAKPSGWASDRINLVLTIDLARQDRLAAKVTLGAGVLAFGPEFTTSPLAEALRGVLWGRTPTFSTTEPFERIDIQALSAVHEYLQQTAARMGVAGPEPILSADEAAGQVVFYPDRQSTGVFVRLLGTILGASGLLYPAPLPGAYALPVVVTDIAPAGKVRDLGVELMSAVRQAKKS